MAFGPTPHRFANATLDNNGEENEEEEAGESHKGKREMRKARQRPRGDQAENWEPHRHHPAFGRPHASVTTTFLYHPPVAQPIQDTEPHHHKPWSDCPDRPTSKGARQHPSDTESPEEQVMGQDVSETDLANGKELSLQHAPEKQHLCLSAYYDDRAKRRVDQVFHWCCFPLFSHTSKRERHRSVVVANVYGSIPWRGVHVVKDPIRDTKFCRVKTLGRV